MSLEVYRVHLQLKLGNWNYKLNVYVGFGDRMRTRVLGVLDTRAGANLIRAVLLLSIALSSVDTSKGLMNLASAFGQKTDILDILGVDI